MWSLSARAWLRGFKITAPMPSPRVKPSALASHMCDFPVGESMCSCVAKSASYKLYGLELACCIEKATYLGQADETLGSEHHVCCRRNGYLGLACPQSLDG